MNERQLRRSAHFMAVCVVALVSCAGGCGPREKDVAMLNQFIQKPRSPVSGVNYRVLPPDVLSIQSRFVPELRNVAQQVRPDGILNLPLVGEIYVAGLTPKEIEAKIATAAEYYYEDADATVSVAGYNSQRIYVFGQVAAPGPQQWTGTNTVLDVLSRSQPTTLAWPERIKLVRGQSPKRGGYLTAEDELVLRGGGDVEEGVIAVREALPADERARSTVATDGWTADAMVMEIDLMAMVKSGDLSQNILLQPDDMIFVPANPLAEVGLAIQMLLFPVRPMVETVRTPATIATDTIIP